MKRTDSGMITRCGTAPALCAAPKTRPPCCPAPEAEEPALSDSLILSSSSSSTLESGDETGSEITPPDAAAAAPRKRVSWAPTADVRVVYCGSESPCDDTKEDLWVSIEGDGEGDGEEDGDSALAEATADEDEDEDAVDPEEAAIRSQLVGCLCAKKQRGRRRRRHRPDFAAMYGCGTCVASSCTVTSAECSDSDDDDTGGSDFIDIDDGKPIRVVVACSAMESSIDSIFTFT